MARSAASGTTFALANAFQRALVFLLLPVYTAAMAPEAYGRLGLMLSVQACAMIILAAGLDAAVTRRYFTYRDDTESRDRFVASIWRFLVIGTTAIAAIATAVVLLGFSATELVRPDELALTLVSAATFVAATVVPLTVLRASQRLKPFLILSAVTAGATTVLTLVFVVGLKEEVTGWFVATTIANVLVFLTALRVVPWQRLDHYDRAGVGSALGLGLSLVPHALSLWALSLGNRIVLAGSITATELGVYTLAANLAMPAMVLMQSMNQGFLPSYAMAQHEDQYDQLSDVVTLQALVVALVSLVVAVLAPPIVTILDAAYLPAISIVPWLVLGAFFWGMYQLPMNVISMVHGRTQLVWVIGLTSTVIGLGSLVVLVEDYGLDAAGPASAIGYLALLILTLIYLRALGDSLPMHRDKVAAGIALAAGVYAAATILPVDGIAGFVSRGVLVAAGCAAIAVIGGLRPHHFARLRARVGG